MIHVCRQHVFFNMFCTKRSSQTKNGHNIASTNQPFFKKTQFQRKLCWLHRCYVKKGNHLVGRCYLKKPTVFTKISMKPMTSPGSLPNFGIAKVQVLDQTSHAMEGGARAEIWRLNGLAAYTLNTVIILGYDVTYWIFFCYVMGFFCLV